MEGEDVAQAPRNLLRRLIETPAHEGMHVKTGIEAEFFLLSPDGSQISDEYDTAAKAMLRSASSYAPL
jgi:glutamine synthetase